MSPFREHYGAFDPETLAWTELQRNGGSFDPVSMRTFVADLLIEFAQQGETDPRRLKALSLAPVKQRIAILHPVKTHRLAS